MIYKYKYEKRIETILFRIVECCGGIDHGESVCTACKIRAMKCTKLVARGHMPLFYYMGLIRDIVAKK